MSPFARYLLILLKHAFGPREPKVPFAESVRRGYMKEFESPDGCPEAFAHFKHVGALFGEVDQDFQNKAVAALRRAIAKRPHDHKLVHEYNEFKRVLDGDIPSGFGGLRFGTC